ncbi:hypothetical protein F4553_006173 [Allocatelliglobosispora scoriae]|uniref:YCII-related domain-containing protein n=1 Tax=Allocatelliglobosispora scoriae TaxID=643052 RepID=A0A841C067_9ACTN|nr:YciI family protein [Allocatelliglobosispora scoriae]MBB5872739.1 hypothetical protein [Allocatelliglobosispora scoriae]
MKQYLISIYQPEGGSLPPAELAVVMSDLAKVNEEMQAAGAWVFAGGLHAQSSATVLRHAEGEVLVTDGPFAESKEYLGGITIIQAADLDEALGWARRIAEAIKLPIEVRPFQ